MHTTTQVKGDTIKARCTFCGDATSAPNKGLGRAKIAAWKTQHQHTDEAKPTPS